MNPFDYVNAICDSKQNLIVDEISEKSYNPFMINRTLSYHFDTVLLANEMNQRAHLDKKLQNDFLINTVRKKKRFAKWVKPLSSDDLEVVKEYYGYSNEKARQALPLLNGEQMGQLRQRVFKGGK
jgi:NACalpha-BTF3-like transcription factor